MKAFKVALQLLTRIPVTIPGAIEREEYGQSLLFYPLVGLLLALVLLVPALFAPVLPANLLAALLLVAWVLLTGALHIDGLAGCADAWFGGYGDREKTLRIMKDQASGPAAITSVVLVLLVKYSALVVVLQQNYYLLGLSLVLSLVLSRLAVVYLFASSDYVRKVGLGFTIAENLQKPLARNMVFGLLVVALLVGMTTGAMAVLAAVLSFSVVDALSRKRLGGFTGDVAGALIEICEASVLVFCCFSFFMPRVF